MAHQGCRFRYGFGDEHINGILGQALKNATEPDERKLLAVSPFTAENDDQTILRLSKLLSINSNEKNTINENGG